MGSVVNPKQIVGYKYFMTQLMGLAVGPIDFVKKITIGEQTAWEGVLKDGETIDIERENLFGGTKGEGGVAGKLTALFGASDQIVPQAIKAKINHTEPDSISDFRGVANLWFDGMVCSMTWIPKTWEMSLVRRKSGWDGECWQPDLCEIDLKATVSTEVILTDEQIAEQSSLLNSSDGHTGVYHDVTETIHAMNPIHVIYQLLTDRTFGLGYPRDWIDEVGFLAAARQCKAESLGVCYEYDCNSKTVTEAIGDMINTIAAALYIDRVTGLITIKLIRKDYDEDMLPVFDQNSGLISIEADQSTGSGSQPNELHIVYYSPITNEQRTVKRTDNASIMSLGYKIAQSSTYDACPTAELAARLGDRDLAANDASIKRYTLKFDRRAWRIYPASVFKLNEPTLGINMEIMRTVDVQDTSMVDGTITVKVATDNFDLPATTNVVDIVSEWHPPSSFPKAVGTFVVQEASYRDAVLTLGTDSASQLDRNVGTSVTYAMQPSGTAMSFSVNTQANNGDWDTDSDTAPFTDIGYLQNALDEWSTSLAVTGLSYTDGIAVGEGIQIDSEVVRIDELRDDGTYTIARGCGDTIPARHSVNSMVIFLDTGYLVDETEYGLYETVNTRIITNMINSSTDPALAPTQTVVMSGRQGKPYPPGDVKINGKVFTETVTADGDLTVSWANRNRLVSQDKLIAHTEASQDLETDTVTYIGVYDGNTSVAYYSGTDTSWVWSKVEQAKAFADNQILAGQTRKLTLKMGSRYQGAGNPQINSWQEYELGVIVTSTVEYIKPSAEKLNSVWHKASLRKHITGLGADTLELNARWQRANLRHHITGLGANAFVAKMNWKQAALKARPRFVPDLWKASATWHKASLASHVVSGERLLDDNVSWRITEDNVDRDLEK